MVKQRLNTRLVSLAFIGSLVLAPLAQAAFSDVTGGEFAQYINDLSGKGIISSNATNFYPKNNLSRGELAKVLVKAANLPINNNGGQRFSDVSTSNVFFDYVATLANNGTINGYSDGTFRPNGNVSRGEFAKMVAGSFGFSINTAGGPHFSYDVPLGSTFYTFVETLYNRNVVNGYGGIQFGVNDPVSREQMAKIVSLGLQSKAGTLAPRVTTSATVEKEVALTFTPSLPRLTVNPSSSKVELQPVNYPYLPSGFMYNLWVVDAASTHSAGQFNVRNNSITDARGIAMSPNFNLPVSWSGVTRLFVTIEATRSPVSPSNNVIARGNASGNDTFDADFPIGIPSTSARAYFTKGSAGQVNVLNVELAQAPDLRPAGWSYQVWYTKNGQAQTAGTFTANGSRIVFNSSELPVDLMTVNEISISIAPSQAISSSATNLVLWRGNTGVASTVTGTAPATSTAQDTALYRGLTSSLTSVSIRARTVMESNSEAIIQAYAVSPELAEGEEQAIVVKISDPSGRPISDLDLTMSRVDGPSARFSDPQEVGDNTGIYIGTYRTEDDVDSTETAIVRISVDDDSSDRDEFVSVPSVEVSFDVSTSDRIGSPRALEVDIPKTKLVIDENEDDLQNAEMIVLVAAMDSNDRAVRTVLGSSLTLTANSDSATGTVKANIKYFRLDDRFFDVDNEDSDITSTRNLIIQLIPGSGSDSFDPIVTDSYRVQAQFIAEDD